MTNPPPGTSSMSYCSPSASPQMKQRRSPSICDVTMRRASLSPMTRVCSSRQVSRVGSLLMRTLALSPTLKLRGMCMTNIGPFSDFYTSGSSRLRLRVHHGSSAHTRSSSVAVGALAAEKRLFLNVPRERLVGAPFSKKFCDINERLNSERIRPFVDISRLFAAKCHHRAFLRHIPKQRHHRPTGDSVIGQAGTVSRTC